MIILILLASQKTVLIVLVSQKVVYSDFFDEINLNVRDAVDDAALLDPLYESVAGPVVRDREAQRVFRLCDLNLLWPTLFCFMQSAMIVEIK